MSSSAGPRGDERGLHVTESRAPERRVWWGHFEAPDETADWLVKAAHSLADAAKVGRWDLVLGLLAKPDVRLEVNGWRPGGPSWFTPLHQAAWLGAPSDVVEQLVDLGAWRTLRAADGRTPADIARDRGHEHLAELLAPRSLRTTGSERCDALDEPLAQLVESRIRPQLSVRLRHPQTSVLTELPEGSTLWHGIPGMYGGFRIELMRGYLHVESWCRVVGGSGQAHVVTTEGAILVDQGFV